MKTVVVTGSDGFVANHTIPALIRSGYDVIGVDIRMRNGIDICNKEAMLDVIRPGYKILHLAAVARFASADCDPSETYRTNAGGTSVVFEAAQEAGAERVVMASTASVYMPAWNTPIDEFHPISGNSHYGYSKAFAECLIQLYHVPFVILRYAHLYGPKKQHGGLIDNFIARIERGEAPIMYGGWQSNDFTFIDDVVQANLLALETPYINEAFNIGSGEETTTHQAMNEMKKITEYHGPIVKKAIRTVDAPRFFLDIGKAKRLLGYKPKWTFKDGLAKTIEQKNGVE